MPLFENNISPYISFVEGSAPSSPAATNFRLYYDSADHLLKWKNSAGTVTSIAANPMTAANDLIIGGTAGAPARLATVASKVLSTDGSGVISWATAGAGGYVSGETGYTQITSSVNVTATTEATANTIVTAAGIAYDGSTTILIEFFSPFIHPDTTVAGRDLSLFLYDGSTSLGYFGYTVGPAAVDRSTPCFIQLRLTPSAATKTYSIRGAVSAGTGVVGAGAGAAGNNVPAYIRQTKV